MCEYYYTIILLYNKKLKYFLLYNSIQHNIVFLSTKPIKQSFLIKNR